MEVSCLPPPSDSCRLSVCLPLLPVCSRLLDRCQSPTLGLSTLHPHTHRGNYSLGACLLSLCSTIYHQSVHRHLSSSLLHPDITGPQGPGPTSAAITWASPLSFSPSLSLPFGFSLSLVLLPLPPLSSLPLGSLTLPWQSAFIRSRWWKPIVTKVSSCQPQRPFRGPTACTLYLSSPPWHPPLRLPLPFATILLKSWPHLCCFCLQLRPLQTLMSLFSAAVHFYLCQPLLESPLSNLLQMSLFMGSGCFSHYINMCIKWALHID